MTWKQVLEQLHGRPDGARVSVPLGIEHPSVAGFKRGRGWPKGQKSDWRLRIGGGRGMHVQEYADRWEAHVDRVDPRVSAWRHTRQDLPGVVVGAAAGAGTAVGFALGHPLIGAAVGLLCGGLLSDSPRRRLKRARRS